MGNNGPSNHALPKEARKPLAVNLFSVRRELIANFSGTHARLAEMGYIGIEPMVFGDIPLEFLPEDMRVPTSPPHEYRGMLDELGLRVTSLHGAAGRGEWHIVELDECATGIFEALEQSATCLIDQGLSIERT